MELAVDVTMSFWPKRSWIAMKLKKLKKEKNRNTQIKKRHVSKCLGKGIKGGSMIYFMY